MDSVGRRCEVAKSRNTGVVVIVVGSFLVVSTRHSPTAWCCSSPRLDDLVSDGSDDGGNGNSVVVSLGWTIVVLAYSIPVVGFADELWFLVGVFFSERGAMWVRTRMKNEALPYPVSCVRAVIGGSRG
jgi:hypothetical protein